MFVVSAVMVTLFMGGYSFPVPWVDGLLMAQTPGTVMWFLGGAFQIGTFLIKTYLISVLLMMWMLIIERIWYFRLVEPGESKRVLDAWHARADRTSWYAAQIRSLLISEVRRELHRSIGLIRTRHACDGPRETSVVDRHSAVNTDVHDHGGLPETRCQGLLAGGFPNGRNDYNCVLSTSPT